MAEAPTQVDELLSGFCEEAADLLQDLPSKVAQFERDHGDSEPIDVIFRSVHTIKGNAGFFGLQSLKSFAHSLEDAFDDIRQGATVLTEDLSRRLVEGIDVLSEMIAQTASGKLPSELSDDQRELLADIQALCAQSESRSIEDILLDEINELAAEIAAADVEFADKWALRLQGMAESLGGGAEENGGDDAARPTAESMIDCQFERNGSNAAEAVRPALDYFVLVGKGKHSKDDGAKFVAALDALANWADENGAAQLAAAVRQGQTNFNTIYNSPLEIDSYLLSTVWGCIEPELTKLKKEPPKAKAEDAKSTDEKGAGNAEGAKQGDAATKSRFLRVREACVDDFLDDVSSLFITCERFKDLHTRMAAQMRSHELVEELRQINATLGSQSTSLQRSVVELRKAPVRGLFAKFPRVARSLAANLGKQLDVHLEGEDVEIDKSLVEDLDGPLMHMVRNVCDHGIETPEEREGRGAAPAGNLWLKCELTKTHVAIVVRDDGRGIDPEKLRRKSVEKGVLTADQAKALSQQEATELIFHPGFSTAEKISEISGRGVGLDVVRTRLREHNGDVKVDSKLGEGTTFRLEIPIRRAVVVAEGLLVRHAEAVYVVPFEHIQEIVRLEEKAVSSVLGKTVATVRGKPYAAVRLGESLGTPGSSAKPRDGVLIKGKTSTICLLVDAVMGQRKVVVSDLASVLPNCDRVGGVAQLGAGKLALVLNVADLIRAASSGAE